FPVSLDDGRRSDYPSLEPVGDQRPSRQQCYESSFLHLSTQVGEIPRRTGLLMATRSRLPPGVGKRQPDLVGISAQPAPERSHGARGIGQVHYKGLGKPPTSMD